MSYKSFISELLNPCSTSYNSLRLSSTARKNKKNIFPVFPRMSRNPDKDNIVSDKAVYELAYKQDYNR